MLLFIPLLYVHAAIAEDGTDYMSPTVTTTITAVPSVEPSVTAEQSENRGRRKVPDAIITMRAKIKNEREQIMNDLKNKMTASHEAIKAEIMKIRDQRKQQTVERINANIAEKNKKITDNFSHMLSVMTKQLSEIKDRVDTHKIAGASTAAYDAAAAKAAASIVTAQKAVDAQAAKTYTITIQSDQTVKTDVSAVVTQFNADLKGVLSLVRTAREDVISTRKEARLIMEPNISVSPKPSKIPKPSENPEPSESPEPEPSVTTTQ
jgi:hypothetical protein